MAGHTRFPDVELRLIDPLGRSLGNSSEGKRIPNAQYGRVIDIPNNATGSKAIAAEVCEAIQGDYLVVISVHSKGKYGLSVHADDGGNGNESMATGVDTLYSTCKFEFRFLMNAHSVTDPICEIPQADHSHR